MKIDLCKLLGVEEGEEFKIEHISCEDLIYKIQDNCLKRRQQDSKNFTSSGFGINKINEITNIIKLPKKKQFSQETLNFFKCINKKYKWIAKDMNDDVHAFCEKPIKESRYWFYDGCFYISKAFNQAIFNQILWEDEA